MESSGAKRLFLSSLTLVAAILALGVYQVPQPWRGLLIGWLLLFLTLGSLIMRLVRHYFEFKALQLTTRGNAPRRAEPKPSRAAHSPRRLDVIGERGGGSGRLTVR